MSFIQWLGDWLRKVSTSVKSITAGTNSLTYTRHNNDSVTIPLTLESDLYVKKTGDTVTGNINSLYGVDGVETVNQFSGEMAGDDLWALRTGITSNPDPAGAQGTTSDNGFLEIATADNGTEPIYISQYEGDHMLPDSQGVRFYRQVRRATLLDEQGNTVFPGTVTAASFNGNATSATHATNANYATSAGTASKLGSVDVGSATQPIYLDDGVPTACTYQLLKTVPADAKFTDTVYSVATTSANGLMSSADKTKLDNLPAWAIANSAGRASNAMIGAWNPAIRALDNTNHITIVGGMDTGALSGAKLILNGAERTDNEGWFVLQAGNANGYKQLIGKPDGTLTWGGTNVIYTHPTTAGNKHIPSGGSSGQILRWSADGTAAWGADNDTVTTASTSGSGNAVTSVTASNGALTVKKDSTFLLSNANAVSASKLQTARTISAGNLEYQGSASFDGSANVTLNVTPYRAHAGNGNTNNYPYHYIGTTGVLTSSNSDYVVTFLVSREFYGAGYGICRVIVRTNNVANSALATCEVRWLVRDPRLPVDCVQVGFRNTSGDTIADIYCKTAGNYNNTQFRVLGIGSRSSSSRVFTLNNSQEVSNTTTSDPKTSTYSYKTIAAGATALHSSKPYTDTIVAVDSHAIETARSLNSNGYVKYSSGLVIEWGTATFGNTKTITTTKPLSCTTLIAFATDIVQDANATQGYDTDISWASGKSTTTKETFLAGSTYAGIDRFAYLIIGTA